MTKRSDYQRQHNGASAGSAMVVSLQEALWRLRIAPTAADLVRMLPPEALVAEDRVDLSLCGE